MAVRSARATALLLGSGATGAGRDRTSARRTPRALPRPLLSARDRHLVGRFSYGVTPALAARGAPRRRRRGVVRAPARPRVDPGPRRRRSCAAGGRAWPAAPTDLWHRQRDEIEGGWEVMADYQRWVLVRRIRSRRQVLEMMTEFWENHFNVPVNGDAQCTWRVEYGDVDPRARARPLRGPAARPSITHPAMLINLDNVSSTAQHPNENLGRELLELHTVGRGDVRRGRRQGLRPDPHRLDASTCGTPSSAEYRPERHARGAVRVMGFTHRQRRRRRPRR